MSFFQIKKKEKKGGAKDRKCLSDCMKKIIKRECESLKGRARRSCKKTAHLQCKTNCLFYK
jgi:hypothetical protein